MNESLAIIKPFWSQITKKNSMIRYHIDKIVKSNLETNSISYDNPPTQLLTSAVWKFVDELYKNLDGIELGRINADKDILESLVENIFSYVCGQIEHGSAEKVDNEIIKELLEESKKQESNTNIDDICNKISEFYRTSKIL